MTAKLTHIAGIGGTTAAVLVQHKFKTVAAIAHAEIDELSAVPGFSAARAEKTIDAAKQLLDSTITGIDTDADAANSDIEAALNEFASQADATKAKKDKKKKDKKKKGKTKDKKNKKNKKNKKKNKKNKKGK